MESQFYDPRATTSHSFERQRFVGANGVDTATTTTGGQNPIFDDQGRSQYQQQHQQQQPNHGGYNGSSPTAANTPVVVAALPPGLIVLLVINACLSAIIVVCIIITCIGLLAFKNTASNELDLAHRLLPRLIAMTSVQFGDGRLRYLDPQVAANATAATNSLRNNPNATQEEHEKAEQIHVESLRAAREERASTLTAVDGILASLELDMLTPPLDDDTKLAFYAAAMSVMRTDRLLFAAEDVVVQIDAQLKSLSVFNISEAQQLMQMGQVIANTTEDFLREVSLGTKAIPIRIMGP